MNLISVRINRRNRRVRSAKRLVIAASVLGLALQSLGATQADDTSIILVSSIKGATPFIRHLNFKVSPISNLKSVQFSINPRPGSVTRPISATYSTGYLTNRGYLDSTGNMKVPVFGLYDGFNNTVTLKYAFKDNSSRQSVFSVPTIGFNDPCRYKQRTTVQPRTRSTSLSYDFMLLKNACSPFSPALMDTDGTLRWVGSAGVRSVSSAFFDNAIYLGSGPQLFRIELDGTVSVVGDYRNIAVTGFHHNIDPGKYGLFLEVNTKTDVESVILEVDKDGNFLKRWEMAAIISDAMRAGGDNPGAFVRRGEDWFHSNAVTYRRRDDSLIVSSRENFVIALAYGSGAIKWILGDTSKAWYQYPSLRKYALTVPPNGVAPIGQHAVSITRSDRLLLLDNGYRSSNQTPPGNSRQYAVPRKYVLNLVQRTAPQIWSYDRSTNSPLCSSVYEDAPNNYLVDYATIGGFHGGAEIVGLEANGQAVFDYKYSTRYCDQMFNALPIHLEGLIF